MKRLTKWNGSKYVLVNGMGYGQTRMFTDRLAAYENTELEPYEIELMIEIFKTIGEKIPNGSAGDWKGFQTRAFFEFLKKEMEKNETGSN